MEPKSHDFFKQLLETPSPSGYERPVQELVRDYAGGFADEVRTDVHGNVIACINPGAPLRLMLAGHCDQIGLVVTHIDEKGFIYTQPIGGWDPQIPQGHHVTIRGKKGHVPGVIGKAPIHLMRAEARSKVTQIADMWVDIGAKDKKAAERLDVRFFRPAGITERLRQTGTRTAVQVTARSPRRRILRSSPWTLRSSRKKPSSPRGPISGIALAAMPFLPLASSTTALAVPSACNRIIHTAPKGLSEWL